MNSKMDLTAVRREYESSPVAQGSLDPNPFVEFEAWMQQASDLDLLDANAMVLATASLDGQPSARVVLLKHFDQTGFCWYTDSRSRKGQELAQNPKASLLFHWRDLSRQVRIDGLVEPMSADDAEHYFQSRPEGSRFSAAASHQSAVIPNRAALESEMSRLRQAYPDGDVPRPKAWLGYRLSPTYFEFWQGQRSRSHDRIAYSQNDQDWQKKRLSP